MSQAKSLGLSEELLLRNLSSPVYKIDQVRKTSYGIEQGGRLTVFGGFLQVTVDTHTRETENCGLNHLCDWFRYGLDKLVLIERVTENVS